MPRRPPASRTPTRRPLPHELTDALRGEPPGRRAPRFQPHRPRTTPGMFFALPPATGEAPFRLRPAACGLPETKRGPAAPASLSSQALCRHSLLLRPRWAWWVSVSPRRGARRSPIQSTRADAGRLGLQTTFAPRSVCAQCTRIARGLARSGMGTSGKRGNPFRPLRPPIRLWCSFHSEFLVL